MSITQRKFRSQTSDNMDRWKAEAGRVREEKSRRKKIREEKEPEERRCRRTKEKAEKSRNTLFFQWFVAPGDWKVGSLKRRARSHLGRWEMRWKIARRCGAKHTSKSKCTKHFKVAALLEVEMLKKGTPLWREARFQVKFYKTFQLRNTFGNWDVEKSAPGCGAKHMSKWRVQNTPWSEHL